MTKPKRIVPPIPPSHQALADRIRVYYPWWKRLEPECVFVGQETDSGKADPTAPTYPETAWMCIWEDGVNRDVAAIMVINERSDRYDISFSRQDAEGGDQLCVEIADDPRSPFLNIFQSEGVLPGLSAITITK
jgi:hypothetical protein